MPELVSESHGPRTGVPTQLPAMPGLPPIASKLVPLEQARNLYEKVRQRSGGFSLRTLLDEMQVAIQVDATDVSRIPAKGPVVVVANHPFGILDGAVVSVLLSRVRSDVKVMTNSVLSGIPELQQSCIFVDPFGTPESVQNNRNALRQAMAWLRDGGMLAVFPAGEVSHWRLPENEIADPEWNHTAARLIRRFSATALPIFFCGRNSVPFHLMGMIHPRLRTVFLLQEFLQQEGKIVRVRVCNPIPSEAIANLPDDHEATEYLRWRTYLLAQRGRTSMQVPNGLRPILPRKPQQAINEGAPQKTQIAEIEALPEDRRLAENAEFCVYAAQSQEIPQVLQEIGRLREITFREVGEGTGKSTDLDRFDLYYWHLLLWSKTRREIAGAYRAANSEEVIRGHGIRGLYTSTLFRYDEALFRGMGPALELGRSFVTPGYQRQYAPLLMLWKGIARFVAARPETPMLFGAVSISNEYNRASRELIVRFFASRNQSNELAHLVQPRNPFRPAWLRRYDCPAMCQALRDLDDLAESIADIEVDGKGLPILLKQYAKVGGKMLGFNVDRKFSNALDGLVMVDLRQTEPTVLERYMGREGLTRFSKYHGLHCNIVQSSVE
jgi:putative hemolysin